MLVAALLVPCLWAAGMPAPADSLGMVLARMGSVVAVEAECDALCVCDCLSLTLVGEDGVRLDIALGYAEDRPHCGFYAGARSPRSTDAVPIPVGSTFELILMRMMDRYVLQAAGTTDTPDRGIGCWIRALYQYRRQVDLYRALHFLYPESELDRIFSAEYAGLAEEEKAVFRDICTMYGGCPYWGREHGFREVGGSRPDWGGCR